MCVSNILRVTRASPCVLFRVRRAFLESHGIGCAVQGSGFRVQGSGLRVQGSGLRAQGSGFRVQGLPRVQSSDI
jgi:hypothetical protein